jgi:hypothetical protein
VHQGWHDAIAIGIAAADLAGLDASPDAAVGLDGKVFQEQRVHGALEADMKLVDLAFGEGEDRHTREAQALEDARHVLLIAADAVERSDSTILNRPACASANSDWIPDRMSDAPEMARSE